MKATIRDAATLAAIRPIEISAYLRATGWSQGSSQPNEWALWLSGGEQGAEVEALVPLNRRVRDFSARIADLLRALEVVEQRSQLEILRDLLTTCADVVRIRFVDSETGDGSIPLEEGAVIVQKARDMIAAATCAAISPRAYFHARKPNQASEYLRRVRLGQTEQGSYVLTIISPVAIGMADRQHLFDVEEPFERRVTMTLANSLRATKAAAQEATASGDFRSFRSAVDLGVSANLCDAIVGLSNPDHDRALEVGFSWSRSRPVAAECVREVVIPPDAIPVVAEAGRLFRETSDREDFELRGPVVKLERPEGVELGRVTVYGFVDEQPRKVVLELTGAAYHAAVQAHDERTIVSCLGTLMREGNIFRMTEPRAFSIEQED